MDKIKLICVGKIKETYEKEAVFEYLKRLQPFADILVIEIKEEQIPKNPSHAEIEAALKAEAVKINKETEGYKKIALCIEGKSVSSIDFASILKENSNKGLKTAFIIGSAFGLCEEIKDNADLKISLSKLTFTHRHARILLIEQIYRAYSIINNGKYHKEL